jgi:hypothetical protein
MVIPNETVEISHNYYIVGPSYDYLEAGAGNWVIIAPGPEEKSAIEDWNPGMMSNADKKKYGIETIPREQVEKRGIELGIPPENIKEFLASDEDVLYFAHNLTVYPVDTDGNKIDSNGNIIK